MPTSDGKIRWGFLGTARIGASSYVPAIRASRNGVLHAVASRDAAKAREFAARHGFARAHASYEALLADPEVDAIYNPLPNSLHAEWSIRAARAGKPVLCEKPLAANAAEARAMVEAFAQAGLPLSEAFMYRRHPLTRRALEIARSGRLGRLRLLRAHFTTGLNDAANIRLNRELAGGALRDLGCYCVDILRQAAGAEPIEARALAVAHATGGVDQRLAGVLKFPDGALGEFGCGFGLTLACAYEFQGERGRLAVDHGAMVAWPGEAFKIKLWVGDAYEEIVVPPANHYTLTAEEFADAVLGRGPLTTDPQDAVRGIELLDRLLADADLV